MAKRDDKPTDEPQKTAPDVLAWTDPQRAGLVEAVLRRLVADGVTVAAIGGPTRAGLSEFGKAFDLPVMDDLRQMRVAHPTSVVLLATTESVGRGDVQAARAAGAIVLMIEPPLTEVGPPDATLWTPPAESTDAADTSAPGATPGQSGRVMVTPLLRTSPGWRAAVDADAIAMIGRVRTVAVSVLGPTDLGGVYARLFDAMDIVHHLFGTADTIDATLSGPLTEPPADLRGMTGHLTAHLRFGSGASAVVQVADRAVTFDRFVTVLGDRGQLHVSDTAFDLVAREPQRESADDAAPAPADAPPRSLHVSLDVSTDPADLITHQWRLLRDRPAAIEHGDVRRIIASCQAASLSTRTGELESPATLLRLSGL
ncbi:MAG: hypothetical protein GC159_21410 [Phycisphaera sp.]|nr:hypothetical protein [Phycisphaera sp.]